jgi:hypothetical protein
MNPMKILTSAAGLACILFLSGCGSSSTAIQPMPDATPMGAGSPARYAAGTLSAGSTEIPAHVAQAVTGHLDSELRKRGLASAADDGNAIRIDATATYYRMRSGFSRMMVGMLAGKDGIKCDVQLVDKKSGKTVGKFQVSSYNLTAVGGEDDVARMLAEEIAKALEKYKA